jgi:hypothetical protein
MKLAERLVGVMYISGRWYLSANCKALEGNICQRTANSREVPQSLRSFGMTGASKLYFYYYVYIMTNKHKNVLYVGVTNSLGRRVYEYEKGLIK